MNMHQSNIYFSLPGNLTLWFKSDAGQLDDSAIKILRAYVPGLTELKSEQSHVDVVLEHKENTTTKIEQRDNKIILHGPWGDESIADLYHLVYSITRTQLLKKNFYSVHGACVETNGKCILILGHSGSGKTTVALKLAKEYGMEIVSGNKTVTEFSGQNLKVIVS